MGDIQIISDGSETSTGSSIRSVESSIDPDQKIAVLEEQVKQLQGENSYRKELKKWTVGTAMGAIVALITIFSFFTSIYEKQMDRILELTKPSEKICVNPALSTELFTNK
jgi:hypothetical protein